MSVSVTNSAISVRFSPEVEPTDCALNKATRSLSFGFRQQGSETEVTETGTRPEKFDPDVQLDGGWQSPVVMRTGILLLPRARRPVQSPILRSA